MEHERHQHPCHDITETLQRCYQKQGGEDGENCLREQLSQKKCLAELFCHREAHKYYYGRITPSSASSNSSKFWWQRLGGSSPERAVRDSKVSPSLTCSTLFESFAKPENELLIPSEGVGKENRSYCRTVALELANCLQRKKRWHLLPLLYTYLSSSIIIEHHSNVTT